MVASVPSILIVEDDPFIRKLLVSAFAREPLRVDTAVDGVDALEQLDRTAYAALLLDLMLPRMNGFEVLERLALRHPLPVIFVITAYDQATTERLDPKIVHAIVRKPFDLENVVPVVRECALLCNPAPFPVDTSTEQRPRV